MTHFVLDDPLLDAQALRAVGLEPYDGAILGEVIATAGRVKGTDLDNWVQEWNASGQAAFDRAEKAEAAGAIESARIAYWCASTYFRTAGLMLLEPPLGDALKQANARQTSAFRRGAALMSQPPEVVEIPFEDTTLPGYFFRVDTDPRARATVILIGGYDGTAEELYFFNGAAALARGYNVLAFDGPGQGAALIQRGMLMRPDWENVITPVFDYVAARPDVDEKRVGLIGLSLGGHLAPRAASGEHRPAACIADCGAYDMYAAFLNRLPEPVRSQFAAGDEQTRTQVGAMLEQMVAQPTAGWSLRRGLVVHGVADPLSLMDQYKDYSLAGRAAHITCPDLRLQRRRRRHQRQRTRPGGRPDLPARVRDLHSRRRCR